VSQFLEQDEGVLLTNMLAPGTIGTADQVAPDSASEGQAENRRMVARSCKRTYRRDLDLLPQRKLPVYYRKNTGQYSTCKQTVNESPDILVIGADRMKFSPVPTRKDRKHIHRRLCT
jgi:hypothetical protein